MGITQNKAQTIECLESNVIDLVLMDIQLSDEIDGITLADLVVSQFNVPVVFITGMNDSANMERVLNSRPFGFVQKPFSTNVIKTVIEISINRFKLETRLKNSQKKLKALNQDLEKKVLARTKNLDINNQSLIQEINQRKKIEASLQKSLEKERALNELKTRIVNFISHEIKTPLTSIKSSAQLIEYYLEESQPIEGIKKHSQNIDKAVNSLTRLINETLQIGELDAGSSVIKLEKLEIILVAEEIIEQIQMGIGPGHNFNIKVHDQFNNEILTDYRLFHQILNNLLTNAVKYSPNNKEIIVELSSDNKGHSIKVIDKGMGIPKTDQQYLFDMFHRASNTKEIEGVGLGLAIVKKSIEQLNGTIHFLSKENSGTSFTVHLPFLA